eukprot:gene6300-6947_t
MPTGREDLLEHADADHGMNSMEVESAVSVDSSKHGSVDDASRVAAMGGLASYLPLRLEDPDIPVTLSEFYGSVMVPAPGLPWYKVFLSFVGPGALVAVGYMDPGNWSTDIAGGSGFGYHLLCVVLLSSIMAMFLQALSLKLGLATGKDLAQLCRDSYRKEVNWMLWVIMELAICATDVAEVLGSAIAFKLLFNLPLIAGVCITACDVLLVLFLNGKRFRLIESFVALLVLVIAVSFLAQLILSRPNALELFSGFVPTAELFSNKKMLLVGIGIIGATVMPHNLFLHSSIVLTRQIDRNNEEAVKEAVKYNTIDSNISLTCAFFVNASILIVSAATFHKQGYTDIATLEDAHSLLDPLLHSKAASILFGVALLASGQNSTLTGTLTGQIVMEGFMTWKMSPTLRRMATRLLAIVPAVLAVAIGGDKSANELLILSQVLLSFALPFAVVPLVHLTSCSSVMGVYANSLWLKVIVCIIAAIIIVLNVILLVLQS